MSKNNNDIDLKNAVNQKHIKFYDKTFKTLELILDEYIKELKNADFEFLEMPKNSIATIDFLISAIGKVQKGQRLALGLDNEILENIEPEINIVEGLNKEKI